MPTSRWTGDLMSVPRLSFAKNSGDVSSTVTVAAMSPFVCPNFAAMRSRSSFFGSVAPKYAISFVEMNRAVAGWSATMSRTSFTPNFPDLPSAVFSPASCFSFTNVGTRPSRQNVREASATVGRLAVPGGASRVHPVSARAISLMSFSP